MGGSKSSNSTQSTDNTITQNPTNAYSSPLYQPLTQVMQQQNSLNGKVGTNLNYTNPTISGMNYNSPTAPAMSYMAENGVKASNPSNFDPIVQNSISQQTAQIKGNQANNDRSAAETLSRTPGNNTTLLNALKFQGHNAAMGATNAIYPGAIEQQRGINTDANNFNLQSQGLLQQLVGQNNQTKLSAADQQQNFITAANSARLNAANTTNGINASNNATKLNANQVQQGGQNQLLQSLLQMIQIGSGKTQSTVGTTNTSGTEKKTFL